MENKDVKDYFNKGKDFYESENFEEAIKCFAEVVRLDPKHSEAFYKLGNALSDLAKIKQSEDLYREAFEKYDEATRWEPEYTEAFYKWGNALSDLAKIKQSEDLYREAFEKYDEATSLKSDYVDAFCNWGDALSELAQIKQNEFLFRDAFEKYKEATSNKTQNAEIFNKWGNALSYLTQIKQDENLFKEAFEKYGKATSLDPEYPHAFYNWGIALSDLALIKQEESSSLFKEAKEKKDKSNELFESAQIKQKESLSLFEDAKEKYKKAIDLEKDDIDFFNNLGIVLSDLAQINKDESLFRESFEVFRKASEDFKKDSETPDIKTSYTNIFYNWGSKFYSLAKLENKDETLFKEELEKFKKASENIDDCDIFLIKGELYLLLEQETEAMKCFLKSKKDILEILTFLYEENQEPITQIEILYPILNNSDTTDCRFFKKITKGIDKDKLEKYKKIYILSILIISQLHVKNKNEKLMAYYTKKTISQKMLFKKDEENLSRFLQKMLFKKDEENLSRFRLNAINYSNDPDEGKTLLEYLFKEESPTMEELSTGYGAFAGCFTFNYDSLNQFRLYGKEKGEEGIGLSLVFNDNFFSEEAQMAIKGKAKTDIGQSNAGERGEYALFRCMYINPTTQRVETVGHKETHLFYRENKEKPDKEKKSSKDIDKITEDYHKYIKGIIGNVREKMNELKEYVEKFSKELDPIIVGKLLINLRYLTKHIAFIEEQECRIVRICPLNDRKRVKTDDDFKQIYVEYLEIPNYVDKIYFGPKATGMELFQDVLTHKNIHIPCKKSMNRLT
jgi:tetratricopeptide (TPR) repeat protein